MKWPYINEVEDHIPKAAENFRNSGPSPILLFDWFYGCVLLGKWTALTIMSCLIWPSSSVPLSEPAPYYECGLSLLCQTYWRVRTVLGSVLGCLPGVTSLCGWIGLCPPVEFVEPPSHATKDSTRNHIMFTFKQMKSLQACLKSGEYIENIEFLENMADTKKWVTPQPLARVTAVVCSINTIQLKTVPLDRRSEQLNETQLEKQTQYRASIVIDVKGGSRYKTVKYDLNELQPDIRNLPPCHPGKKASHELHKTELPKERR